MLRYGKMKVAKLFAMELCEKFWLDLSFYSKSVKRKVSVAGVETIRFVGRLKLPGRLVHFCGLVSCERQKVFKVDVIPPTSMSCRTEALNVWAKIMLFEVGLRHLERFTVRGWNLKVVDSTVLIQWESLKMGVGWQNL